MFLMMGYWALREGGEGLGSLGEEVSAQFTVKPFSTRKLR